MDSTREQMDSPNHEEIAARAYEIYNRDGGQDGRDSDHWFEAEQELRARRKSIGGNGNGNGRAQNNSGQKSAAPSANRNASSGLGQAVTGEAAMSTALSFAGEENKKGRSAGAPRPAKASRN